MAEQPRVRHRVRLLAAAPVTVGLALVTGCTSGHSHHGAGGQSTAQAGQAASQSGDASMPGMSMPAGGGGTAASSAPGGSPAAGGASAAPAGANAVQITNFAFSPQTITVKVGTTVTWTNHDQDAHTVTAINGPFKSKTLNTNATFSYTFTKAGSFNYLCTIHPFMTAKVVVTQ